MSGSFRVAALLFVIALACCIPGIGQNPPGPTARGGSTPYNYAANVGNTALSRFSTVLIGSVVAEDLQPVTNATVLLVCNGLVRGSATVKSKGEFSLTVDRTVDGVHPVPLVGCEVHAESGASTSESHQVTSLGSSETRDVGNLVLRTAAPDGGTMVSANSLAAPSDARKLLHKGKTAAAKRNWTEAQQYFERAIQVYPKFAEAWHELGLIYQAQSRRHNARTAFEQALAADPLFVRPYFGLVGLAADAQDWREMQRTSDTANAVFPDPLMLFYNAIANFNLHDLPAAEKSLQRAAQIDRDHHVPQVQLLLGDVLIEKHDYAGAAARVREFLAYSPTGPQAEAARSELSRLEQLSPR